MALKSSNEPRYPLFFLLLILSVALGSLFYLPGTEPLLGKVVAGGSIILLSVLFWAAGLWRQGGGRWRYGLDLTIVGLWFSTIIVAFWFSTDRTVSLLGVYGHYQGLIVFALLAAAFFLAVQLDWTPDRLRLFLVAVVGSAFLQAAVALAQTAGGRFGFELFGVGHSYFRATGLMGNANALGSFIAPIVPLGLCLAVTLTGARRRLAAAGAAVIALGALATLSIAAWFSIIAMSLALAVEWRRREYGFDRKFWLAALVAFLVLGGFFALSSAHLLGPQSILERIMNLADANGSIYHRARLWEASRLLVPQRPLFGWGLDTFKFVAPNYGDLVVTRNLSPHPHNLALELAVHSGIISLLIFLALAGRALWRAWFREATNEEHWLKDARLWLGLALFGQLVVSLTQSLNFQPFLLFWLLIGILAAGNGAKMRSTRVPKAAAAVLVLAAATALVGGVWLGARAISAERAYRRALRKSMPPAIALENLDRAVDLNSYFPVYRYRYIRVITKKGRLGPADFQKARDLIDAGHAVQPLDPTLYLVEARLYLAQGNRYAPQAYKAADEALKRYPNSYAALIIMGDISYRRKEYARAADEYTRAAKIKSNSFYLWFTLGKARQKSQDRPGALIAYREALKIKPRSEAVLKEVKRVENALQRRH